MRRCGGPRALDGKQRDRAAEQDGEQVEADRPRMILLRQM